MFLIALTKGGSFDFADELPAGVVIIESPALGIREYLDKLKTSDGEAGKLTTAFGRSTGAGA